MKLIVTSPSNYTLFLNENPIFPTVEKWLDVIENNTTAEKLYQKLGFQYVQTKTLYYDVVGKMTFKLYELVL